MNRKDVQIEIAQLAVLHGYRHNRVAVILPTRDAASTFAREFYELIDDVPEWLIADPIYRLHKLRFEIGSTTVSFVESHLCLKGMTLNAVYRSDRFSTQLIAEQDMCILPVLASTAEMSCFDRLITFEDR